MYTMGVPMHTQQQQPKKRPNPYVVGDNVLETVRGLGGNVTKSAQDAATQIASDALQEIISGRPKQKQPSERIHRDETVPMEPREQIQPQISNKDLIKPLIQKDLAETKQKLDAIRQELQALSKSVRGLQQEIQTAVMEMPVEPGVYHILFFEQLKLVLQGIRERVDDSRVWLSAWNGNVKKKRGYWGMYKKHGTTFGLSSERTLATQAG
jgi:hypothetical protein